MKAFLEIELIGDNIVQEFKFYRNLTDDLLPGLGALTFGSYPPSGWVAEITGFDKKYKYNRQFLRFKKDYSRSNSKGSRGVYAEYILESGKIYDVKSRKSRYFCTVNDNGDIIKLSESEVIECLKDRLELMSILPQDNE
jgi:hypothetical protein